MRKQILWLVSLIGCAFLVSNIALAGGVVDPTAPAVQHKDRGFYIGAQAGYSTTGYQNSTFKTGYTATEFENNGFAPHIYIGYQFNPYIATEFSIIYIRRPIFRNITNPAKTKKTTANIKNNIVYLVARLSYPIWRFSFYIKGGIGYIVRNGIVLAGVRVLKQGELFTPVYGAGFTFKLGQHWVFDTTWMQAPANRGNQLPMTNFVGIGVVYHFFG